MAPPPFQVELASATSSCPHDSHSTLVSRSTELFLSLGRLVANLALEYQLSFKFVIRVVQRGNADILISGITDSDTVSDGLGQLSDSYSSLHSPSTPISQAASDCNLRLTYQWNLLARHLNFKQLSNFSSSLLLSI